MQKKINNKTIAKNVTTSILVQLVSMGVSMMLNLFVPNGIDEYQYAYWQTFVLYLGYGGVLHFGLLDGIVLRYSQYDYEELDRTTFHTLFMTLLGSTTVMAVGAIAVALLFFTGITRLTIILVAVGIITRNVFTYNSFLFQITNRIGEYAKLIVVQRLTYGVIVIAMLLLGVNDFWWYCVAELVGDAASMVIAAMYNKGMYFGKLLPVKAAFQEWGTNVASGIKLMLANWSSILLLGSAKMVVQWHWDELVFGKVAFSFAVSNLFMNIVVAVSVVLFPALKRMEKDQMPGMYKSIRGIISPLLLAALLCYYPGCFLIQLILPKYAESLPYLGILFPMILFTSKVSLLTNNYLKAYRKESQMLMINIVSIVLAFALFGIGAYWLNNVTAVLVCVVLANIFNSVVSEIVVMKTTGVRIVKDIVVEVIMAIVFIAATLYLNQLQGCLVYLGAMVVYAVVFRENIKTLFGGLMGFLRRGKPGNH